MWTMLQAAVDAFCLVQSETHMGEGFKKRCEFAEAVEVAVTTKQMPYSMLSFNLHILVCRLYDQMKARGSPAQENELWIERLIHRLKESTRYRTSAEPEKVAANQILLYQSLLDLPIIMGMDLKTIAELRHASYQGIKNADTYACGQDGIMCIGSAVKS
jgi:hypothetical protein